MLHFSNNFSSDVYAISRAEKMHGVINAKLTQMEKKKATRASPEDGPSNMSCVCRSSSPMLYVHTTLVLPKPPSGSFF